MPLSRFRLRTLMIAVAVVAVMLGAGITLQRRRASFLRTARLHEERAFYLNGRDVHDDAESGLISELLGHHFRLMKQYRRAARYPWLPVPPDPPEPK